MTNCEFDLNRAIGLAKASHQMRGKGGKSPSVETVRRWANPKVGCYPAGKEGVLLVLQTHKLNGEILTMPEWVADFEAARVKLSARQVAAPAPRQRSSKKRARDIARAEARLDRAGIR